MPADKGNYKYNNYICPQIRGKYMKQNIKIFHQYFCIDYETESYYMVIVESMDVKKPIFTYSVKAPDQLQAIEHIFRYYYHILN
jgi:hypothetical protein